MPDLFKEVLPSLNLKKEHLIDNDPLVENEYNAYIINKAYSFGMDTLLYANEMNINSHLDNKLQYDFYFYGLSKQKRFNKWIKKENFDDIEIVKEFYGCSNKKAKEYLTILNKQQIKEMKRLLGKGE